VLRSQAARWLYNDTCYENGTDYLGWDIRTVPRTADPAQCQVCPDHLILWRPGVLNLLSVKTPVLPGISNDCTAV
jgi:hypothetical protein